MTVARSIDGWGGGSTYSITLDRVGRATYEGGTRAVREGTYTSRATPAIIVAVWDRVSQPGALTYIDPKLRCYDAAGLAVAIDYLDGTRVTFGHSCDGPPENIATGAALDSLFAPLVWIK